MCLVFSGLKGLIWQMELKKEGGVLPEGEAWEDSPYTPGPEIEKTQVLRWPSGLSLLSLQAFTLLCILQPVPGPPHPLPCSLQFPIIITIIAESYWHRAWHFTCIFHSNLMRQLF